MKLSPRNRYLLIEPIEEESGKQEEDASHSGVLLPEEYKPKKPPYMAAKVREVSPNCTILVSKSDLIVVQRSMVEEIEVKGEIFYTILENHVFGVLEGK